jgi:hypothetical protein
MVLRLYRPKVLCTISTNREARRIRLSASSAVTTAMPDSAAERFAAPAEK